MPPALAARPTCPAEDRIIPMSNFQRFRSLIVVSAASAVLFAGSTPSALAQDAGPVPPEDIAKTRDNFPETGDSQIASVVGALSGMYRGQDHTLYIAPVELPDAANTMYVELVMAGEENHPVRQQLWVPFRMDGDLYMRVCDLPMAMRDLVVGMWAAPQLYPAASIAQYSPLGDLSIDANDERVHVSSDHPMPMAFEGATHYTMRIEHSADGVRWVDAGRAINGDEIFAKNATMKTRPEVPQARELEHGILVWDLRTGFEGPIAENKDSIVFYFDEWTMDGFLIDSTDRPHRGGQVFTIPDEKKAIRSWNLGVIGMRQGTIRRVYDPASSNGIVNGEAKPFRGQKLPIITEMDCISVKDNTP